MEEDVSIINQDKPTHNSDTLLATLRVYMFSSLAKWVGIASFLDSLYTVTRFNSHSRIQSKRNKCCNSSTLSMNKQLKLKTKKYFTEQQKGKVKVEILKKKKNFFNPQKTE